MSEMARYIFDMPNLLFLIMGAVALVAIVAGSITKVVAVRSQERTRREVAAYVAEGSLNPDQAVAILKAGRSEVV